MVLQEKESTDPFETLKKEVQDELEQSRKALKEITMMVEQSQAEITKLTQRNASITAHLQQVQAQFETIPRADIRTAYASALDAQQRLLVMRGQLEKLQSDQGYLQKLVTYLDKMQQLFPEAGDKKSSKGNSPSNILGMVIEAQESERKRLSVQMHDGPAQALSNFIVQVEIAARFLEMDANKAKEELNNLKGTATSTFQKIRNFIFELRPMMLDDLGLVPTLRRYADSFKEQHGVDIHLEVKGKERRLESYQEIVLFRSLQELMGNAVRHNMDLSGKLQVSVQIIMEDNQVRVSVSDNGKGFDYQPDEKMEGIGLKLIKERVELLGGTLQIDTAAGKGCRVFLQIPSIDIG